MKITKQALLSAVDADIITPRQAERLDAHFRALPTAAPTFSLVNVFYYLGGGIAIGAAAIFMDLTWERFGGAGLFVIALAYAAVGAAMTAKFHRTQGRAIAAGVCAVFVVAMAPLAMFGLQIWLGWRPGGDGGDHAALREWRQSAAGYAHDMAMSAAALAAGVFLLWRLRYGFLVMPIAIALWFFSVDAAGLVAGGHPLLETRVSIVFGLANLALALAVDVKTRKRADYAFWLYLFGAMSFWGGLTFTESDSELGKFLYFCINLCLVGFGAVLARRALVVFGALGVCVYLGHLANKVFADSWLFPMALMAIGLLVVWLGALWHRNEDALNRKARGFLPAALREALEARG